MIESPGPMTLGEILDRTAQFYRSRFWVFFGISVLPTGVVLVMALAAFVFLAWWNNGGAGGASKGVTQAIAIAFLAGVALFALPLMLGMTSLAEAAINHAVNRAWYGEKATIRAAYAAIWPRGWRYVGLYLLKTVAVWGPPFLAYILIVAVAGLAASTAGGGFLLVPLVLLLVAAVLGYIVWVALQLSLAFPACVVEQSTVWAAVKRSVALSKGSRGRIFLLYLLGTVLGWVLSGGILMLATIAMALLPGAHNPQRAQAIATIVLFISYGAGFAVQALIKPIYGIALLLFYYDQRIRLEGYDIEWMMQQAGLVAPVAADGGAPVEAPVEAPIAIEAAPVLPEMAAEVAAPTLVNEAQPLMAIEPDEVQSGAREELR